MQSDREDLAEEIRSIIFRFHGDREPWLRSTRGGWSTETNLALWDHLEENDINPRLIDAAKEILLRHCGTEPEVWLYENSMSVNISAQISIDMGTQLELEVPRLYPVATASIARVTRSPRGHPIVDEVPMWPDRSNIIVEWRQTVERFGYRFLSADAIALTQVINGFPAATYLFDCGYPDDYRSDELR